MNQFELYQRYESQFKRLSSGESLIRIGHLWYGEDEDSTLMSIRSISDKKISTVFPLRAESAMSFTSSEAPTDAVLVQIVVHYNSFDRLVKELIALSLCTPVVQVINPAISAIVAPLAHNTDFYSNCGGLPMKDVSSLVNGDSDEIREIYARAVIPMVINNIAIQTMQESGENITLTFQLTRVKSSAGGNNLNSERPLVFLKNISDVYIQTGILNKLKNYGGDNKTVDILSQVMDIDVYKIRKIVEELRLEDINKKPGVDLIELADTSKIEPLVEIYKWVDSFLNSGYNISESRDDYAFTEVLPEGGFNPEITYDIADCQYLMYIVKYIANTISESATSELLKKLGGSINLPYDRFKSVSYDDIARDRTFTVSSMYTSEKVLQDEINKNIEVFDLSSFFDGDNSGAYNDKLSTLIKGASAVCSDYYYANSNETGASVEKLLDRNLCTISPGVEYSLTSVVNALIWKLNKAVDATKSQKASNAKLKTLLDKVYVFKTYCEANKVTFVTGDTDTSILSGLSRSGFSTKIFDDSSNAADAAHGVTDKVFGQVMQTAVSNVNSQLKAKGIKRKFVFTSVRRTILQQYYLASIGREKVEVMYKMMEIAGIPRESTTPPESYKNTLTSANPTPYNSHSLGYAVDIAPDDGNYILHPDGSRDEESTFKILADEVYKLATAANIKIKWGGYGGSFVSPDGNNGFVIGKKKDSNGNIVDVYDWVHFNLYIESPEQYAKDRNIVYGKYPTYADVLALAKKLVNGEAGITFKGNVSDNALRIEYEKLFSAGSSLTDNLLSDIYSGLKRYLKINLSDLVESINISYTPGSTVPIPLEGAKAPVVQCMGGRQVDISINFKVTDIVRVAEISTMFGVTPSVLKTISMLQAARSIYSSESTAMSKRRLQKIYNVVSRQQIYDNLKDLVNGQQEVELDDPIYINNTFLNALGMNTFIATGYTVQTTDAITNGFDITLNLSYSNLRYRNNESLMISKADISESILPYCVRIPFGKAADEEDNGDSIFSSKDERALAYMSSINSKEELRFYKELASACQGLAFPELVGVYTLSKIYDLYVGLCHAEDIITAFGSYSDSYTDETGEVKKTISIPKKVEDISLTNYGHVMLLMAYGELINKNGGNATPAKDFMDKLFATVNNYYVEDCQLSGDVMTNSLTEAAISDALSKGSAAAAVIAIDNVSSKYYAKRKLFKVKGKSLKTAKAPKILGKFAIISSAISVISGVGSVVLAGASAGIEKFNDKGTLGYSLGSLIPLMSHLMMAEYINAMKSGPGQTKEFINEFSLKAYRILHGEYGVFDPKDGFLYFDISNRSVSKSSSSYLPITKLVLSMSTGFVSVNSDRYTSSLKSIKDVMSKNVNSFVNGDGQLVNTFSAAYALTINALSARANKYFSSITPVTAFEMLTDTADVITGHGKAYSDGAVSGLEHADNVIKSIFSQTRMPDIAISVVTSAQNVYKEGSYISTAIAKAYKYYNDKYVVSETSNGTSNKKYRISDGRLVGMFIEDNFYDTDAKDTDGNSIPNVLREAVLEILSVLVGHGSQIAIDGYIYDKASNSRKHISDVNQETGSNSNKIEYELVKALVDNSFTVMDLTEDCLSRDAALKTASRRLVRNLYESFKDPLNLSTLGIPFLQYVVDALLIYFGGTVIGLVLSFLAVALTFLFIAAIIVLLIVFGASILAAVIGGTFSVNSLKSMFSLSMWMLSRLGEGLDRGRLITIFDTADAWSLKPLLLDHTIYDMYNSTFPDYPVVIPSTKSVYGSSFAANQSYIPVPPDGYVYRIANIEQTLKTLESSMNTLIDMAAQSAPNNIKDAYEKIRDSLEKGLDSETTWSRKNIAACVKSCYGVKSKVGGNKKPVYELCTALNLMADVTKDDDSVCPPAYYVTVGTAPATLTSELDNKAGIGIYLIPDSEGNVSDVEVLFAKTESFFGKTDKLPFSKWKVLADRILENRLYSGKNDGNKQVSSAIGFDAKISSYFLEKDFDNVDKYESITLNVYQLSALFKSIADLARTLINVSVADMNIAAKLTTTTMGDLEVIRGLVGSTFGNVGVPGLQQFRNSMGEISLKNMYQSTRYVSGYSFPTIKLYFIEQDQEAWYLFDDVYSYTSVIDAVVNSHVNHASSYLKLRLTNLHGRLNNINADKFNTENIFTKGQDPNSPLNSIFVKPGCRIKLQIGMDSILTDDDTVFCGEITDIDFGPITTIEAVSYGSVFNTVLAGEKAKVYGELGYLGGAISKAITAVTKFVKDSYARYFLGCGGNYAVNAVKSVRDVISNILADSTEIVSAISDFTINPSLIETEGTVNDETMFTNYRSALMTNRYIPELSKQFADITGVNMNIHVNRQIYENISILGSTDAEFRASTFASMLNCLNANGNGAWVVYNQTIWDALQEVNLLLPNKLMLVRPYETRGTLVWGGGDDYYRYKRTIDLSSVVSTLAYEQCKKFAEAGPSFLYKLIESISTIAKDPSNNNTALISISSMLTALVYYVQKEVALIKIDTVAETTQATSNMRDHSGYQIGASSYDMSKAMTASKANEDEKLLTGNTADTATNDFYIITLMESLKNDSSVSDIAIFAKAVYRAYCYLLVSANGSTSQDIIKAKRDFEKNITALISNPNKTISTKDINDYLKTALTKLSDMKISGLSDSAFKVSEGWKSSIRSKVVPLISSTKEEQSKIDLSGTAITTKDIPAVVLYLFESSVLTLLEQIRKITGSRSTSFKKISDIHIKVSGRDIVKNDLVLQMPYNTVSLDYPKDFSGEPSAADIVRQGDEELNNFILPIHYKLRDSAQRRYNTYFKNINAFPGGRQSLRNAVAVNILCNLAKDMYSGSITLLGDSSIREGDRILIWDENTDMFGFIRVRSHTLIMNPKDGYLSVVEPEMITNSTSFLEKDASSVIFSLLRSGIFLAAAAYMGKNVGKTAKVIASRYRLSLIKNGLEDSLRAKAAATVEKYAPDTMGKALVSPVSVPFTFLRWNVKRIKKAQQIRREEEAARKAELLAEACSNTEKTLVRVDNVITKATDPARAAVSNAVNSAKRTVESVINNVRSRWKLSMWVNSELNNGIGGLESSVKSALNSSYKSKSSKILYSEDCSGFFHMPLTEVEQSSVGVLGPKFRYQNDTSPCRVIDIMNGSQISFSLPGTVEQVTLLSKKYEEAILSNTLFTSMFKSRVVNLSITPIETVKNADGLITETKFATRIELIATDRNVDDIVITTEDITDAWYKHDADVLSRIIALQEGKPVKEVIYSEKEYFILTRLYSIGDGVFTESRSINNNIIPEMVANLKENELLEMCLKNENKFFSNSIKGQVEVIDGAFNVRKNAKSIIPKGTVVDPVNSVRRTFMKDEEFKSLLERDTYDRTVFTDMSGPQDGKQSLGTHLYSGLINTNSEYSEITSVASRQDLLYEELVTRYTHDDVPINDLSDILVFKNSDLNTMYGTADKSYSFVSSSGKPRSLSISCYVEMDSETSRLMTFTELQNIKVDGKFPEPADNYQYLEDLYLNIRQMRKNHRYVETVIDDALKNQNGANSIQPKKKYTAKEVEELLDSLDEIISSNKKGAVSKDLFTNFEKTEDGHYITSQEGFLKLKEYYRIASKLYSAKPSTCISRFSEVFKDADTTDIAAAAKLFKSKIVKIISGNTGSAGKNMKRYSSLFKSGQLDDDALVGMLGGAIENAAITYRNSFSDGWFIKRAAELVADSKSGKSSFSLEEISAKLEEEVYEKGTDIFINEFKSTFGSDSEISAMLDSKEASELRDALSDLIRQMLKEESVSVKSGSDKAVSAISQLSAEERMAVVLGAQQCENIIPKESLKSLGWCFVKTMGAYWTAESVLDTAQEITDIMMAVPGTADNVTINPLFFRGNPMVVGLDGVEKKDQDKPSVYDVLVGSRFSIFGSEIYHGITDPVFIAQKELWEQKYASGMVSGKATADTKSSKIDDSYKNRDLYDLPKN